MTTPQERADKLVEAAILKLQQAKAKAAKIKAQAAAKMAKVERTKDTRRKILAGSVVLSRMDRGQLLQMLDTVLTRPDDRALFDLPPLALPAPLEGGQKQG